MSRHPKVADVVVFGIPDPGQWGERVAAAIVSRVDPPPSLEELRDFCRSQIAGYKLPKALSLVKEIPRNMTGKPLKRILREELLKADRNQLASDI